VAKAKTIESQYLPQGFLEKFFVIVSMGREIDVGSEIEVKSLYLHTLKKSTDFFLFFEHLYIIPPYKKLGT
jgi:hypothetical protein